MGRAEETQTMCPSVGAVVGGKSGSAWGVFHSQVVAGGVGGGVREKFES